MTELEAKAKDCIENHTHKLVDKPTKQDIYLREESIFISGYRLGATENGVHWHGNEEPEEHKEIIARSQYGCTLIAGYFDNAWRNVWNGGKLDFEKDVVCWAYVKLPKE